MQTLEELQDSVAYALGSSHCPTDDYQRALRALVELRIRCEKAYGLLWATAEEDAPRDEELAARFREWHRQNPDPAL